MCNCKYSLDLQDPAATPTKQTKKDKKNKKAVNGEKKDDRSSPEANAQEQMAAQRATGGELTAPPVVVSTLTVMLLDLFIFLFFSYIKHLHLKLRKCFHFVKVI